jgi:Domain of unknown function (DUF222)
VFDDGEPTAVGAYGTDRGPSYGETLLTRIVACERAVAAVQAEELALIAEFIRVRPAEAGEQLRHGASEFAVDELAAELHLSRGAAGGRMSLAFALTERLPGTAAALAAGDLDLPRARAIAAVTDHLDAPVAAVVERRVLPRATTQTTGQLRASLTRAVIAVDPAGAQARHERAVTERRVVVTAQPDGMAELYALLPAPAATAVYTAIDAHARRPGTPAGAPMEARRADALVELVTRHRAAPATGAGATETAGDDTAAGGARSDCSSLAPLVQVTVAATTLLGLDDRPGELAGHGPIPAQVARGLAADPTGTWRRILTDPADGSVLDVGRRGYRPPLPLARFVTARDGTCRFPGCRQPARRCDLDHVKPWPAGPTAASNLISLCRHHHRLKHSGRWTVTADHHGTVTWTAPTGRGYETRPPPIADPATSDNRPASGHPAGEHG